MEKKDWKQKWKIKNSGTAFGLCLVGVAAFSVLFATGQVKQAQREKEQIAAEQLAQAEQAEDGILPEAPDPGRAGRSPLPGGDVGGNGSFRFR